MTTNLVYITFNQTPVYLGYKIQYLETNLLSMGLQRIVTDNIHITSDNRLITTRKCTWLPDLSNSVYIDMTNADI